MEILFIDEERRVKEVLSCIYDEKDSSDGFPYEWRER